MTELQKEETKAALTVGLVLGLVAAIWIVCLTYAALAGWDGPHGQDPWYQAQLVPDGPSKGQSCCSISDGVTAEEDIRDGHYWTRFTDNTGIRHDWMQVPDEAILPTNHNGAPVVWYGTQSNQVFIRCYARGSGI